MIKNTHLPKIHRADRYSSLKIFGFSIAVGLIMTVPFWRYQLGWLVCIVLLPFIYLLQVLNRTDLTKRSKIGFIWLSGWVFLLGVTFWLIQTEPGRWTGLTGWLSISSLVLTNILFSGFLSLGFVFFGITWVYLKPELWQKRIFLVLPALWVLAEWARSWLFSVISLGPNTTIGPHWNFGDLGFAASVTPLVFLARFMGLYGLGFVIIMINLCVWWLVQRRYKLPSVILASIMVVSFLGYMV
ncbi:hypothetical protein H0W80_04325, partial [Candidatus Saccharibacteria bacterium]|nr:hypothetical protein [Candidatus Saccharibacteria bacterium]